MLGTPDPWSSASFPSLLPPSGQKPGFRGHPGRRAHPRPPMWGETGVQSTGAPGAAKVSGLRFLSRQGWRQQWTQPSGPDVHRPGSVFQPVFFLPLLGTHIP